LKHSARCQGFNLVIICRISGSGNDADELRVDSGAIFWLCNRSKTNMNRICERQFALLSMP